MERCASSAHHYLRLLQKEMRNYNTHYHIMHNTSCTSIPPLGQSSRSNVIAVCETISQNTFNKQLGASIPPRPMMHIALSPIFPQNL